MGLDITVHTKFEVATDFPEDYDDFYDGGYVRTFCYKGFEQSYRGLPVEEENRFYGNGVVKSVGDTWHLGAGGYGGYGQWRELLSQCALLVPAEFVWENTEKYRDMPFFELIHFADNEGSIGPEACADLARDFEENRERVFEHTDDPHFRRKYDEFARAFKDAAGEGFLEFH